jgi:hypothetical protein
VRFVSVRRSRRGSGRDLEGVFNVLKKAFGYRRKDIELYAPNEGSGSIDTIAFTNAVSITQHPAAPAEYVLRREIVNIKDPSCARRRSRRKALNLRLRDAWPDRRLAGSIGIRVVVFAPSGARDRRRDRRCGDARRRGGNGWVPPRVGPRATDLGRRRRRRAGGRW